MAGGGVLGLKKECSDADIRLAYRKLAMTWHPDRWAASGSSASAEEAKERFQEVQGAYSVLSDSGKRLLYDVGFYDGDGDDDEQDVSGMSDFLDEMAEMMRQATPTESLEELQQLFMDMFHGDPAGGFGFQAKSPPCTSASTFAQAPPPCSCEQETEAVDVTEPRRAAVLVGAGREQHADSVSTFGCAGSRSD